MRRTRRHSSHRKQSRRRRRLATRLALTALFLVVLTAPMLLLSRSAEAPPDIEFYAIDVELPVEQAVNRPRFRPQAVDPFALPAIVRDHLVDLEMSGGLNDTVAQIDSDVVADTFGVASNPLPSQSNQLANSKFGLERFDGPSGWAGVGGGPFGGYPSLGPAGQPSANSIGSARSDAAGDAGEGNDTGEEAPSDAADDSGLQDGFIFLPDDTVSGGDGDSSVSTFPATNGLTILSDGNSDSGLFGDTDPVLSLDVQDELVHAPEPASLLLLGSGLVAVAHRLRKRARVQR